MNFKHAMAWCLSISLSLLGSSANRGSVHQKPNLKFFAIDRPLDVELYTERLHAAADESPIKTTLITVAPQKRCNLAVAQALFDAEASVRVNVRLKCPASDLEQPAMGLRPDDEVYISSGLFTAEPGYAYAFSPQSARGKAAIDQLIADTQRTIDNEKSLRPFLTSLAVITLGKFYCIQDKTGTLCHHYFVKSKACPPTAMLVTDSDDAARYTKLLDDPYHIHQIIE